MWETPGSELSTPALGRWGTGPGKFWKSVCIEVHLYHKSDFFCSWLHDRSLKKFRYERHSFRICYIASCLACNSNWSLTTWINYNPFNYWYIVLNQLYLFTCRKILIFWFSTIQSAFCSGHLLCAIKDRPGHIYLAFYVLFHFFQEFFEATAQ